MVSVREIVTSKLFYGSYCHGELLFTKDYYYYYYLLTYLLQLSFHSMAVVTVQILGALIAKRNIRIS